MASAFPCQNCGHGESDVIDSRGSKIMGHVTVRRKRVCKNCGAKYSTFELFAHDVEYLNRIEVGAEKMLDLIIGMRIK